MRATNENIGNDGSNTAWRQRQITIAGGDVYALDFPDTRPNHVHINNLSANNIFAGINTIPSDTIYELMVGSYSQDVIAQDRGVSRCLIFNNGVDEARLIITSFVAAFNPAVLVRGGSSGGSSGGGNSYDGVIRGIQVPLPSGNNNIGRVVVTGMPNMNIATLPPVAVASMPAVAVTTVGTVGTITNLPPVAVASLPPVSFVSNAMKIQGETGYYSFDDVVTTTEKVLTMPHELAAIKHITNDDKDHNLIVAFNTVAISASKNGLNAPIELKPGETITDLNIKVSVIKLKRPTGSGGVRIVGV